MGRAVPVMGHAFLANGARSLDYGTHSPDNWDAQSLLCDTQPWHMGRTVPVMGHAVLATGTR
eukprot:3309809-Pyramimonas_sp.AAC.1